jgi:menaquinone-9 beta-reductase
MFDMYDVVIVGGGIAGGALAAVLARGGVAVAVLERDLVPVDRVRGEFMAHWGVAELQRLGLFDTLAAAGGVFPRRSIPYGSRLASAPEPAEFTGISLAKGRRGTKINPCSSPNVR